MRSVHEILEFLRTLAPERMAESWDNVGLLVGDRAQNVSRVLVALDPFYHVAQEAVAIGADLLLCHHPIWFEMKTLTQDTEAGRTARMLVENHISEISYHTNLDAAPGGVNDVLAELLGLSEIELLEDSGEGCGIGRVGIVREQPLPEFLAYLKQQLGCEGLRYCDGGRLVRKVAVGGGSCSSMLSDVISHGCDTFVTGDVKYNAFQDAAYAGIHLIDAGHYWTENPICAVLAEKLRVQFPDLDVRLSQTHGDVIRFA